MPSQQQTEAEALAEEMRQRNMNTTNDNKPEIDLALLYGKAHHTATQPQPPLYDHASALVRILELQAQRDELLVAFQPIWQEWHKVPYDNQAMNKAVRAMFAVQSAIARATEGGTGQ